MNRSVAVPVRDTTSDFLARNPGFPLLIAPKGEMVSGCAYVLNRRTNFSGMPTNGDLLQVVDMLVSLAKRTGSGITRIVVSPTSVSAHHTTDISAEEVVDMLRTAVLMAGHPVS